MKVVKTTVEASFTKAEYELQKRFNEKPEIYGECDAIDCYGVKCYVCPLFNLTRDETLKYIKNHLEDN